MTSNRKSFWAFIIPATLLRIGISLYILSFILNSTPQLIDSMASSILFDIAIQSLFWGLILLIPLGLLARHFSKQARAATADEQQVFLEQISWSAFFSPFCWALTNKQYAKIIPALIPVYNLYLGAKLALHGRARVWQAKVFSDFSVFRKRQLSLRWKIPLAYLLVLVIGTVLALVLQTMAWAKAVVTGMSDVISTILYAVLSSWRH